MPLVELSLEQILEAVIQLPPEKRQQLIAEIQQIPHGDEARQAFARLRGKFAMPPSKQRRISQLQAKANEGTITANENAELGNLVEECEERTLALAHAVARSKAPRRSNAG